MCCQNRGFGGPNTAFGRRFELPFGSLLISFLISFLISYLYDVAHLLCIHQELRDQLSKLVVSYKICSKIGKATTNLEQLARGIDLLRNVFRRKVIKSAETKLDAQPGFVLIFDQFVIDDEV